MNKRPYLSLSNMKSLAMMIGLTIVPILYFTTRTLFTSAKNNVRLYGSALFLALLGLAQIFNYTPGKPNFYLFLVWPLISLSVLKVILYLFKRLFKRELKPPIDVGRGFHNEDGLDWDRFFLFCFFNFSLSTPMFILAYFYA